MTPYISDEDARFLIDTLLTDIARREEAGAPPSLQANRILTRLNRLIARDAPGAEDAELRLVATELGIDLKGTNMEHAVS